MDTNQVNFWLSINAENFALEALPAVKSKLEQMNDNQMIYLQSASFKKPSTILIIAVLLGWERFFLGDVGLGILKVITGYGCGIWWLIDIFSAKKRAQKYNFQQFHKLTAFADNGTNAPYIPNSQTNNAVSDNSIGAPNYQNVTTPANYNSFDPYKQNTIGNLFILRVKNILLSPKTEWETIDKENKPQNKVLTSYLLLLAAIPAVVALLGYFFYGIFSYMPFGLCLGTGFKVAMMMYITVVGGVYLTALGTNLLAEKFGSVKNFNKAFSLAAHAWTPLCVAGILLIYPVPFLFWLWVIVGVLYALYLLYSGIRPLLKAPLEQLTPYTAICAGSFIAAFFLLIIGLSYMFLGDIYFSFLSYFSYPSHSYPTYFRY